MHEVEAVPGHSIRGRQRQFKDTGWSREGTLWEPLGRRGGQLGSAGRGRKEAAPCCPPEGPAGLTFPYDCVHDQPGWVELLGEVQGPLGRVLICL